MKRNKRRMLAVIIAALVLSMLLSGCKQDIKASEAGGVSNPKEYVCENNDFLAGSYDILSKDAGMTIEREYNSFSVAENGEICAVGAFISSDAVDIYAEEKALESQILKLDDKASVVISTSDETIVERLEFVGKA